MKKRIRSRMPVRRLYTSGIALIVLAFVSNASSQPSSPTTPAFLGPQVSGITDVKAGGFAKVGGRLARLYSEHATYSQQGGRRVLGKFAPSDPIVKLVDSSVVIDAVATTDDAAALLSDLKALGLTNGVSFGRTVSGRLPIAKIEAMAGLPSLHFARAAAMKTNAGLTTSQGDQAMYADIARTKLGVTGAGITVGVLSDSYNCLGDAAANVHSGDLPAGVNILEDFCSKTDHGIDEGRAMMQIIHDLAPGAAGSFHTAFNGQAGFAQGIIDLQQAGAGVIVDDVIYFAEPMFQDGIIAQAVNTVKEAGAAYFSSAGNQARKSYESRYRSSGVTGLGGVLHDFDPGPGMSFFQRISLPAGLITVSFQWDEPYYSVSGKPGAASDYDIWICTPALYCWGTQDNNLGGDPVEVLSLDFGQPVTVYLVVVKISGPVNNLLKYVSFQYEDNINDFNTKSSSIYGHANAAGAEAVGAAFYFKTPEFGTSPPLLETFSSAGGTPILFDTAGTRLPKPTVRQKPDIVAPDGTNNTIIGSDIRDPGDGSDNDTFPNLFGTSAAAPHAGAIAALMLEYQGALPPDEIYSTLESTAADMKTAGFDFDSGFGLVQADAAVAGGIPVQFSEATYSVSEAGPTAKITVTRTMGIDKSVSVNYATSDGTATAGKDYKTSKTMSGTLTFKAGQTSKTFTIPIINDTLNEQNETVNLNLFNPNVGAILGTPSTATLNIVDNDPAGSVQFSAATYSVSEAKTTATITIKRTAGTASGVTVDYATSDGTATADNDYTTKSGTLIFNARQNSKTFTIPIINDNFHEANEAVNLNLSNPTGGATLGTPGLATLTIVDNDPAN